MHAEGCGGGRAVAAASRWVWVGSLDRGVTRRRANHGRPVVGRPHHCCLAARGVPLHRSPPRPSKAAAAVREREEVAHCSRGAPKQATGGAKRRAEPSAYTDSWGGAPVATSRARGVNRRSSTTKNAPSSDAVKASSEGLTPRCSNPGGCSSAGMVASCRSMVKASSLIPCRHRPQSWHLSAPCQPHVDTHQQLPRTWRVPAIARLHRAHAPRVRHRLPRSP
jgi:hypothetical protein